MIHTRTGSAQGRLHQRDTRKACERDEAHFGGRIASSRYSNKLSESSGVSPVLSKYVAPTHMSNGAELVQNRLRFRVAVLD